MDIGGHRFFSKDERVMNLWKEIMPIQGKPSIDDIKLEIFPPGQEATKIIPNAIIGVINGLNANAIANVTAGKPTHCNNIPTITDLGFLNTSLNVCVLRPKATPNITNARIKFTIIIPPSPKLMDTLSSDCNCSFILLYI